jgi:hypothetical protein
VKRDDAGIPREPGPQRESASPDDPARSRPGGPPRDPAPPVDAGWSQPGGPPRELPRDPASAADPGWSQPGGPPPPAADAEPPGSAAPPGTAPPRRRWALAAAAVAALLAAAAVAHVLWWSWPRAHAALPDPADLPGRLLATDRLPVALWIAYPHQNLATLAGAVGRDDGADAWLAALARRTDLPATELPRFGPFPAPPSRELAVASDLAGERVVIAARVEPVFAVLSRIAGLVAGNRWLAGGEVEAFGGRAEVRWAGTLWMVTNLPFVEVLEIAAEEPAAGEGASLARPALAALRLDRPLSLLPAGVHALRADEERLTLSTEAPVDGGAEPGGAGRAARPAGPFGSGTQPPARPDGPGARPAPPPSAPTHSPPDLARLRDVGLPDALLERWGVSLLVLSGPDGPAGGAGALALFRDVGGARRLGPLTFQVPAAAVWHRAGGGRFSLPGEGLLGLLGGGGGDGGGGWRITATGREAEGRARAIGPSITPLLDRLRLGLWADPRPALATLDDVAGFLEAVPLAGRDEARRWRDWQVLLAPLAACERLSIEAWPAAIHLEARDCEG